MKDQLLSVSGLSAGIDEKEILHNVAHGKGGTLPKARPCGWHTAHERAGRSHYHAGLALCQARKRTAARANYGICGGRGKTMLDDARECLDVVVALAATVA